MAACRHSLATGHALQMILACAYRSGSKKRSAVVRLQAALSCQEMGRLLWEGPEVSPQRVATGGNLLNKFRARFPVAVSHAFLHTKISVRWL